jgi:hypothetical protein
VPGSTGCVRERAHTHTSLLSSGSCTISGNDRASVEARFRAHPAAGREEEGTGIRFRSLGVNMPAG